MFSVIFEYICRMRAPARACRPHQSMRTAPNAEPARADKTRYIYLIMNQFKRWNNITGWNVFAIAAMTYLLTMEHALSQSTARNSSPHRTNWRWDTRPGHRSSCCWHASPPLPGPPSTHYVPHMVNAMNCLASAFCILFLFWTITHMARRIITRSGQELTRANILTILGTGIVGALAYTFTDTFWFSAVEGEVYALSSMFTALVVWLMLKWEEQADQPHASRWIVLIAYLMGLSIGVHILNLLTIPALVFIYYFRKTAKITFKGIFWSAVISGAILLFINGIIIPYTVYIGAFVDLFFVNTLGLPVNSVWSSLPWPCWPPSGSASTRATRRGAWC